MLIVTEIASDKMLKGQKLCFQYFASPKKNNSADLLNFSIFADLKIT